MKEPQSEQDINEAISDYTNLLSNNGWKRVVAQLDANIEVLLRQLESGKEEESLDDVKRIRDKLGLLREMRDTPQNMIEKLQAPEAVVENPDPFDTEEDVKKRKELDNTQDE